MTEYHAKMYATDDELGEAIDRLDHFEWADHWHDFVPVEETEAHIVLRKRSPVTVAQPPMVWVCLLYTSPSPRDGLLSRMPSSA